MRLCTHAPPPPGLLLSTINQLLRESSRNAQRVAALRAKMNSVEAWMGKMALPSRLRRRIKSFYAEASSRL